MPTAHMGTITERCTGARRQISWASMAELDSPLDPDTSASLPPNASERKLSMPLLPAEAQHVNAQRQISWTYIADLEESSEHIYRAASPYPASEQDEDEEAGLSSDESSNLFKQPFAKTSWASLVDSENQFSRSESCFSSNKVDKNDDTAKVDSPLLNAVSWAEILEVHHDDVQESETCVFRFDNNDNAPPSNMVEGILESMMEKMGLKCLDDEDLSLHKDRLFADKYVRYKLLGQGSYGEVWSCIRLQDDCEGFAVKFVEKRDAWVVSDVLREINILSRLRDCPHIVHYIECFEEEGRMAIVTEELAGKSLLDHLEDDGHLSERDASLVISDVAKALEYSHALGIAHRDIKPANILCTQKGQPAPCKVADFGLSDMNLSATTPALRTPVGTVQYLAPEVVDIALSDEGLSYTKKCDIWSLGVIMYFLLCSYPPFLDVDCGDECGFVSRGAPCDLCSDQLMRNIQRGEVQFPEEDWAHISPEALDLLRCMLCKDPDQRFSASEVLQHPWVRFEGMQTIPEIMTESQESISSLESSTSGSRPSRGHAIDIPSSINRVRSVSPHARFGSVTNTAWLNTHSPPGLSALSKSPLLSPGKGGVLANLAVRNDDLSAPSLLKRRQNRASVLSPKVDGPFPT